MKFNQCKELPKQSGIYKITNITNNHSYIGQSKNIYNRFNSHHICDYQNPNNCQYNSKIYQAFRKYGLQNFDIQILELCSEEELDKKEIQYIKEYDSFKNGYNMTEGGQFWSPTIHSEETERKRAETRKKNQSLKSENHPRAKLSNDEVLEIRYRYKDGESIKDIYQDYKNLYSLETFRRIILGQSYKDVLNPITKEDIRYCGSNISKEEVLDMRYKYYVDCMLVSKIKKEFYPQYSNATIEGICKRETHKNVKDDIPDLRKRKNYRLNEQQVKEIRYKYDNNICSLKELSKEYGFHIEVIRKCVQRKTYKDIE